MREASEGSKRDGRDMTNRVLGGCFPADRLPGYTRSQPFILQWL